MLQALVQQHSVLDADASGNNSIAIGQSGKTSDRVVSSGVNAIAIGMQSQATGESAIAEGPGSRAGGKYGVALRSYN